jgi:tRNA threonylcarbamoyl adenosine modification protein YjeE
MTPLVQLYSQSESDTADIGKRLADILTTGDIVCLIGNLGAGKSVLARAVIRHLADDPTYSVPSPTFPIVQRYDELSPPVHHYDLYRLHNTGAEDEILELGWEDSLNTAAILVEWPDRLGHLRPAERLDIQITIKGDGEAGCERNITLYPHGGGWQDRIGDQFHAVDGGV